MIQAFQPDLFFCQKANAMTALPPMKNRKVDNMNGENEWRAILTNKKVEPQTK